MTPTITPPRVRVKRAKFGFALGWSWTCSHCGHCGYFALTHGDAFRDAENHYIDDHIYGGVQLATASILEELFGEWGL